MFTKRLIYKIHFLERFCYLCRITLQHIIRIHNSRRYKFFFKGIYKLCSNLIFWNAGSLQCRNKNFCGNFILIEVHVIVKICLQRTCKMLIIIICYNGKFIQFAIQASVTCNINRQTKTTPDFLLLCNFRSTRLQRTKRKDIRVIPSFTKSGMREYKCQRFLKGNKLILLLQNQFDSTVNVFLRFSLQLHRLIGQGRIPSFYINHIILLINSKISLTYL